jgi:hypothetical protein
MMQGLMPIGLENPSLKKNNGKKLAVVMMVVCGHGAMNFYPTDVILENII